MAEPTNEPDDGDEQDVHRYAYERGIRRGYANVQALLAKAGLKRVQAEGGTTLLLPNRTKALELLSAVFELTSGDGS